MSSTNQGPEYFAAENKYLNAQSPEDQIYWLEEMMKNFKKHKGSEAMLANLKTRLKKLKEKAETAKKKSSGKKGIKKEGFQFVLIGLPNSGKSALLSKLTNAPLKSSANPFSTKAPELGTFIHEGVKAQVVDLPPISSENFDIGIVNTADCLLIVIESLNDIEKINPFLFRAPKKRIIIINKSDLLSQTELRKLQETLKSKKIFGIIISSYDSYNIDSLKLLMLSQMDVIRIFTKEPGKPSTKIPVVLQQNSTVKDVAESILKGFSQRIKETRLTGPSSKFPNQKVGLTHILKDLDIVEFHTKG